MKWIALFLFLVLLNTGCNFGKREEELSKKEAAFLQKEQELILREKTVLLKEEELLKREQAIDSSAIKDSLNVYNPVITGVWAVKMICTETTCTGSAIGDIKSEQWHITYEGTNVIAKAMVGESLVRVYTGNYNGTQIELKEANQASSSQPVTNMHVRLRIINETTMDGEREIVRENDCKVVYSLQMEKQ